MRHVSLLGTLIFMGLFLGLIFSSISFAGGRNAAANDNSGCPAVLLTNQEYFPVLIKVIDEARTEIIGSFFLFKAGVHKNNYPDKVLSHIGKAVQRGVKVMMILENSGGYDRNLDAENNRTKQLLDAKGVETYLDSPGKTTHTKLMVIDQRFVFWAAIILHKLR